MSNLSAGDLATLLRELTGLVEQLNVKGDPICPECSKVAICPHCEDLVCKECGHVHCHECGDELLCPDCNADLIECDDSELMAALGDWVRTSRSKAASSHKLRLAWDRYQTRLDDGISSEQKPCKKLEMTIEPTGCSVCTGRNCGSDCGKGHSISCEIGELLVRAKAAEVALEQAYVGEMIDGPGLNDRQTQWLKRGA
jgi:hypothetical protein